MTNVAAGDPHSPVPQLFTPAGWKRVGQPPLYTAVQIAALTSAAQPYDHGPQAQTLEEAAQDVGKWLNERPSRPLDLRSVAMLVAAAQQPREPLSDRQISDAYFEALGSQHLRVQVR